MSIKYIHKQALGKKRKCTIILIVFIMAGDLKIFVFQFFCEEHHYENLEKLLTMSKLAHHLPTKLGAIKRLLAGADVKDAGLMGEQIISKKIRGGGTMISGGPQATIELKSNWKKEPAKPSDLPERPFRHRNRKGKKS